MTTASRTRPCLHRKRTNVSTVLAGQKLGIKEVDYGIWLASFMHMISATSTSSRRPCNPSTTRDLSRLADLRTALNCQDRHFYRPVASSGQ